MKARLSCAVAVTCLACASTARAELVFLANGRTMSVKGHRVEADHVVLQLRTGGEITFSENAITRFEPDEVPYPEPQPVVLPVPVAAPALGLPYADIVDQVATAAGVPARLVHAVIQVESNYQERARSPKGAMGLMQLMPDTARQYAVADPYDPRANIEAGTRHLRSLMDRYPLNLALAAYNAGAAAVDRFRGIPPYAETRDYVARILKLTQ
jgi:soluble lytic murein transglycosylase-like protein